MIHFHPTLDRYSHWITSMGRHAADSMDQAFGNSTADVLLTKPSMSVSGTFHFYGFCRKNKEPTSGLEPLT
jgi:hypothetical protein